MDTEYNKAVDFLNYIQQAYGSASNIENSIKNLEKKRADGIKAGYPVVNIVNEITGLKKTLENYEEAYKITCTDK